MGYEWENGQVSHSFDQMCITSADAMNLRPSAQPDQMPTFGCIADTVNKIYIDNGSAMNAHEHVRIQRLSQFCNGFLNQGLGFFREHIRIALAGLKTAYLFNRNKPDGFVDLRLDPFQVC